MCGYSEKELPSEWGAGDGGIPWDRSLALTRQEDLFSQQNAVTPVPVPLPGQQRGFRVGWPILPPTPTLDPIWESIAGRPFPTIGGSPGGGLPGSPLEISQLLLSQVQPWQGVRPGGSAARCPARHSPPHFAHGAGGPGAKAPKGGLAFLRGQQGEGSKAASWGRQLRRGGVSKIASCGGSGGGGGVPPLDRHGSPL